MPGYVNDISGKQFCLMGKPSSPGFWGHSFSQHLKSRGAFVFPFSEDTDYLVLGAGREKGKAANERKAHKRKIPVLDVTALLHLLRPDILEEIFTFIGGFSQGALALDGGPEQLLTPLNASAAPLSAETTYLVIGERRAKGKTAAMRQYESLKKAGAPIKRMSEIQFLNLIASFAEPSDSLTFPQMVAGLHQVVDPKRIDRAIKMLKKERFTLFSHVDAARVMGMVQSQTRDTQYSCWLHDDGSYGCHSSETWGGELELPDCMGLQGQICKHILVLIMGLSQAGELPTKTALEWAGKGSGRRPKCNEDQAAEIHLAQRGDVLGDVDWRPTETMPEDFYLL